MYYLIIKNKMNLGSYSKINIWINNDIFDLKPKSNLKIKKETIKNNTLYFSLLNWKSKKIVLDLSQNKNIEIEIKNNNKPVFFLIIINMIIISSLILLKINIIYIILEVFFIILQNFLILFFGIGIEVKEIK